MDESKVFEMFEDMADGVETKMNTIFQKIVADKDDAIYQHNFAKLAFLKQLISLLNVRAIGAPAISDPVVESYFACYQDDHTINTALIDSIEHDINDEYRGHSTEEKITQYFGDNKALTAYLENAMVKLLTERGKQINQDGLSYDTLTAKLYAQICVERRQVLSDHTVQKRGSNAILLTYDGITDSIYLTCGDFEAHYHVIDEDESQKIHDKLLVNIEEFSCDLPF